MRNGDVRPVAGSRPLRLAEAPGAVERDDLGVLRHAVRNREDVDVRPVDRPVSHVLLHGHRLRTREVLIEEYFAGRRADVIAEADCHRDGTLHARGEVGEREVVERGRPGRRPAAETVELVAAGEIRAPRNERRDGGDGGVESGNAERLVAAHRTAACAQVAAVPLRQRLRPLECANAAQEHPVVVRLLGSAVGIAKAVVLACVRADVVVVGGFAARVFALPRDGDENAPAVRRRATFVEVRHVEAIAVERGLNRQGGVLRVLRPRDEPLRRHVVAGDGNEELRETDLLRARHEWRQRRLGLRREKRGDAFVPEGVEVGGNRLGGDLPYVRTRPAVPDDVAVHLLVAHVLAVRTEDVDREAHEAGLRKARLHDERTVARRLARLGLAVVALPPPEELPPADGEVRGVAVDERDGERHLLADAVVERVAAARADERQRLGKSGQGEHSDGECADDFQRHLSAIRFHCTISIP